MNQPVNATKMRVIPLQAAAVVEVHKIDLPERDYFFEPADTNLCIFAGIVNNGMKSVLVKNKTDKFVKIPRYMRLGQVVECNLDKGFFMLLGRPSE
jgi:hypothetical protein